MRPLVLALFAALLLLGAVSESEARVYCYNRNTGYFLHWGACYRPVAYRRPGRTYCYSRSSGRFLHWGAC